MNDKLLLSKCNRPINSLDTSLEEWTITPQCLAKILSTPKIGDKEGEYYLRCAGTYRNDKQTADTAYTLVLDGDSRITEDGEIVSGAPDPKLVHDTLAKHGTNHVIYSSHSNGESGGDYHRYRAIIFIKYSREQLKILLNHFHDLLHEDDVMLVNVKENRTWSQPWYFPRTTRDREHLFKSYQYLDGTPPDASAICTEYKTAHPEEKPEPKPQPSKSKTTYSGLKISPIKLFNDHWSTPVNYLMTQGYRYKNFRLLPPHCKIEKAVYGVQICQECKDGVERVYSHHGNDPLNDGYAHDSFDCYKILEHNGDETAALKAIGRSFMINGITLELHNQKQYKKGAASTNVNWAIVEAGL
jgi:hypothetical protein